MNIKPRIKHEKTEEDRKCIAIYLWSMLFLGILVGILAKIFISQVDWAAAVAIMLVASLMLMKGGWLIGIMFYGFYEDMIAPFLKPAKVKR